MLLDAINRGRVGLRDRLVDMILNPPEGGPGDPRGLAQHAMTNEMGAELLGRALPPHVSANIMDLLGLANESVSGAIQSAGGRPFESKAGWDWQDVGANRRGQRRAIDDLERAAAERSPLMSALMRAAWMASGAQPVEDISRAAAWWGGR